MVWVSDMLGSQRGHGVQWQVCLAHLLRDARYAVECGDTAFSAAFKRLLLRAIAIGQRREALKDATLKQYHADLDRRLPGRLLRGRLSPAGRSGFWPLAGGSEELSGVFGGRSNAANRFSSSAMRARAASSCPNNGNSERISASFSAWLRVRPESSCGIA